MKFIKILYISLISLVLLYGVLGFVIVPIVATKKAKEFVKDFYHEDLKVEKIFFNPFRFTVEIYNLSLPDTKHSDFRAKFDYLLVNLDILPLLKKEIRLSEVNLINSYSNFSFYKDGTHTWTSFAPKEEQKKENSSENWSVFVESLSIYHNYFTFRDYSYPTLVEIPIGPLNLSATDLSTAIGKPTKLNQLKIKVGKESELLVFGDVDISPFKMQVDLETKKIPLSIFSSFLSKATYLDIDQGFLNSKTVVSYRGDDFNISGTLGIEDFSLKNSQSGEKLAEFEKLDIEKFIYSLAGNLLNIEKIKLDKPLVSLHFLKNGDLSWNRILKKTEKNKEEKKKDQGFSYAVKKIEIENGILAFKDSQVEPEFRWDMNELSGNLGPLNEALNNKILVDLLGKVEGQGEIVAQGYLFPNTKNKELNLKTDFSNIELFPLSPYSGRYIGYEIKKGKFHLNADVLIKNQKISSQNAVRIDELTLGEEVESKEATSLPVKLVLYLLKDRKGQLKFKLPIEGDLNSPKVSFGSLIKTALVNLIVNVAASPFDFLAELVGDKKEINHFYFEKNSLEPKPDQMQKIVSIKKLLDEKPDLKLEIEGSASKLEMTDDPNDDIRKEKLFALARSRAQKVQKLFTHNKVPLEKIYLLNEKTYSDSSLKSEVNFTLKLK